MKLRIRVQLGFPVTAPEEPQLLSNIMSAERRPGVWTLLGSVTLHVAAAVELIIDPAVEPVRVDLSRNPKFGIAVTTHVRLLKNEVVGIPRHQGQVVDGVRRKSASDIRPPDVD